MQVSKGGLGDKDKEQRGGVFCMGFAPSGGTTRGANSMQKNFLPLPCSLSLSAPPLVCAGVPPTLSVLASPLTLSVLASPLF